MKDPCERCLRYSCDKRESGDIEACPGFVYEPLKPSAVDHNVKPWYTVTVTERWQKGDADQ